jgi:hypothetical protein
MNRSLRLPSVPIELMFLMEPDLLPGEDRRNFEALRQMMIEEIRPETRIEWLWLLDLVERSWEILRYRALKQRILDNFRQATIACLLHRINSAGMPPETSEQVRLHSLRGAIEWKENALAKVEIEAHLARNGFDAIAVNAEVFLQAGREFAMFDSLMHAAQHRRTVLLREITVRRELMVRARRAISFEDGSLSTPSAFNLTGGKGMGES